MGVLGGNHAPIGGGWGYKYPPIDCRPFTFSIFLNSNMNTAAKNNEVMWVKTALVGSERNASSPVNTQGCTTIDNEVVWLKTVAVGSKRKASLPGNTTAKCAKVDVCVDEREPVVRKELPRMLPLMFGKLSGSHARAIRERTQLLMGGSTFKNPHVAVERMANIRNFKGIKLACEKGYLQLARKGVADRVALMAFKEKRLDVLCAVVDAKTPSYEYYHDYLILGVTTNHIGLVSRLLKLKYQPRGWVLGLAMCLGCAKMVTLLRTKPGMVHIDSLGLIVEKGRLELLKTTLMDAEWEQVARRDPSKLVVKAVTHSGSGIYQWLKSNNYKAWWA